MPPARFSRAKSLLNKEKAAFRRLSRLLGNMGKVAAAL